MNLDQTTLHLFGDMPREVANPSRRVVQNISQMEKFIEETNGAKDCYTSIYPLTGMIDKIFFDLDGKGALEDAKKMCEWLRKEGYVAVPIASGKKGFHIHILLRPQKYEDGGKKLLLQKTLGILSSIFGEGEETIMSVDPTTVGDIRQICRIPNTLRPPENLNWCTYLPPDEFFDMTIEEVALHIKSPHTYKYGFNRKLLSLKDLPDGEGPKLKKGWKPIEGDEIPVLPEGGNVFLQNLLRPCLYRHLINNHPKHAVRVATTVDLLQFFNPNEIYYWYSRLGWDDWNSETTKYQIESCKGLKSYSCKKLRSLGIPSVCCVG